MTAAGFKRLGLASAALAVAGIRRLAVLPLMIPADAVREAVNAEIRFVTGLDPVLRGAPLVSLFPTGTATLSDVILGGEPAGEPALAAERLITRLRFLPLLLGRIEVADVSLLRPTISIIFNAVPLQLVELVIETLGRVTRAERQRGISFSEIRIVGGTVILRDEA